MAYGNNYNQGNFQYGNRGNNGYQRNNYPQTTGYSGQQAQPAEPFNLDNFIQARLDTYCAFINAIKERGLEPADFAFALGGWVTSALLESKRG